MGNEIILGPPLLERLVNYVLNHRLVDVVDLTYDVNI